jgi:sulfite reductase alpha subunit-like flavoprotein
MVCGRADVGVCLVTVGQVYVTHRLKEQAAEVWRVLSQPGAAVFVAGSAKKMPTDVYNTIRAVVGEQRGMDEKGAERFMQGLVRARRYCVESWS